MRQFEAWHGGRDGLRDFPRVILAVHDTDCGYATVRDRDGIEQKLEFLQQFEQIGPKYARNIGMDLYLPDFRDFIAIDSRIKNISEAAGFPYEKREYEEHEQFLKSVAEELDLEWELARILYTFENKVLGKL